MPNGSEKFSPIWTGVLSRAPASRRRHNRRAGSAPPASRCSRRRARRPRRSASSSDERLIVVDHQPHVVADALAHGAHRGDVLVERRIAEPQLHRAESRACRAASRPRRRARRGRRSGRGRSCCRRGSAAARRRAAAPAACPAAMRERVPAARRRSRRAPCARCPARRSGRSARVSFAHSAAGSARSPLVSASISPSEAAIAGAAAAQIAEQVGAAGDALLGLEVDQQQRHLRAARPGWCRARNSAAPRPGAPGRRGRSSGGNLRQIRHEISPVGADIAELAAETPRS